jgi:hypothetical protein
LGLASLWLFYLLLKRAISGTSLIVVFALFAINPRLIYYSSELKQYIGDVFVTILLLLLAIQFFEKPSRKGLAILTFSGLLALWFSLPSLFILAGIGITLFLLHLQKRDYTNLRLVAGMGVLWLANIGLLYSLTLGNLSQNSFLREYWQGAFAPMPPWSDWDWYLTGIQKNMDTHFAITHISWIAMLLMLAGWIILFKTKRIFAIALAWIVSITLLASFLQLYPSLERMVLFLVPIWLLLIGILLGFLNSHLQARPFLGALGILLISGYFFYGAIPRTFEQFISPKYFEHIRPSMEYLKGLWREGDAMFITNGAVPAFEYYAPVYGLEGVPYTSSERKDYENPDVILKQLESLDGSNRVWILMSHVYEKGDFNEKDFLLNNLNNIGNEKREFREPGTSVYLYLYDLSE